MKHFLHFLIFLLPAISLAQTSLPLDKKSGRIVYTGVVDAKGVSQMELYHRFKAFYSTYRTGEDRLQVIGDNGSQISGRAFTEVIVNDGTSTEKQRLWYTLIVEVAEGKLSFEMTDFSLQRHCIPARQVPCEVQTKTVAVESILSPSRKKATKYRDTPPYSPERALDNAAASLIAALKTSALTETRIAGIKPD